LFSGPLPPNGEGAGQERKQNRHGGEFGPHLDLRAGVLHGGEEEVTALIVSHSFTISSRRRGEKKAREEEN